MDLTRCELTGRQWINIGSGILAVGIKDNRIDRIWIFRKLRWYK